MSHGIAGAIQMRASNSDADDFYRRRSTITATARCECGKGFPAEVTIPDELVEDRELFGLLTNRMVDLSAKWQDEHIKASDG